MLSTVITIWTATFFVLNAAEMTSIRPDAALDEGTDLASGWDIVDSFLSKVEQYERNKENCTPGTTFNLGEGVVAQYGVNRFRSQAMMAVNRANFLTRLWKNEEDLGVLTSEYFLYSAVRSMVEGDEDVFAAGNCYDEGEYKNYDLFCPYAYRLPNNSNEIMVKDLSIEYMYLGNDSEFFYQAKLKANKKLESVYNASAGKDVELVSCRCRL